MVSSSLAIRLPRELRLSWTGYVYIDPASTLRSWEGQANLQLSRDLAAFSISSRNIIWSLLFALAGDLDWGGKAVPFLLRTEATGKFSESDMHDKRQASIDFNPYSVEYRVIGDSR